MSEKRYDQPFCIIGSVGRFAECYRERGYLPALEPPLEEEIEKPHTDSPWNKQQWDYVQQLKAEIRYIENKINEHIDRTKRRSPALY